MGARSALAFAGGLVNEVVSFVVFSALDLLDVFLCLVYKLADYAKEAEWKPCYCSSSAKDHMITSSGKILVAESGGSKIVCLCSSSSSSSSKLHLEDISDTLYSRPSLVSDVSLKMVRRGLRSTAVANNISALTTTTTTFTINSTIVHMLRGRIGGQQSHPIPRWSDCDCKNCISWSRHPPNGAANSLYVHAEGPKGKQT